MTERISGFLVTLEADMREDDARQVKNAIGMIQGVLAVGPIPGGIDTQIATNRAVSEITHEIMDMLDRRRKEEK